MTILVTGANGQLGNEMRIISKGSTDTYIFTDVNQVEGVETTYLDITNLEAIRTIVKEQNVDAIVNCAAWTNVDGAEDPEKYELVEKLNATAPENLAKAMKELMEELSKAPKVSKNIIEMTNALAKLLLWSCGHRGVRLLLPETNTAS